MAKKADLDAVRPVLEAAEKGFDEVEKVLNKVDKIADKSTAVVETGLEKVADVVPDALDSAIHLSTDGGRKVLKFFRSPKHAALTVLLLSSTAGAALGVAGYFATKKRLEAKIRKEFDEKLESEIAEIRRMYALREKTEFPTPAEAVEALMPPEVAAALRDYRGQGGEPQNTVVVDGEPVLTEVSEQTVDVQALREKMQSGAPVEIVETRTNILVDGNPLTDFDYQAEILTRTPDEPYVISHQEFMENENGYQENTLTYYNGDDILTDDQDTPIPDIEAIVGSESLTRFGHGSNDRNVVYVCNEKTESIYEITMRQGSFSSEVAGFQHSAPVMRRFRPGRDE